MNNGNKKQGEEKMEKYEFHKTVKNFAIANNVSIRRQDNGHYYIIGNECLSVNLQLSLQPTAKSGMVLIKRHLQYKQYKKDARTFVISFLHYNGQFKAKLSSQQWLKAYLMCDGFGSIDAQWADEQCYDWSHVRDSSMEAFEKVATQIKKWIGEVQ